MPEELRRRNLATAATRTVVVGEVVDTLDKWLMDQATTPVGSIVLMVLVFIARVSFDQWNRKRAAKKASKRKRAGSHG